MVITVDDRLYYSLLSVSLDMGWKIRRVRTVEQAREGLPFCAAPIVVFDERLPRADWREALREFNDLSCHPLVLLAVPEVNEDVWQTVLRCHGYDVIKRSARGGEWVRVLQFAWISKHGVSAQATPQVQVTGSHAV